MQNKQKKKLLMSALPVAACVAALGAAAPAAQAAAADSSGGMGYEANLAPINGSGASGDFTMMLNGSQATITEHVSGLAATFMGGPYPHVQHIHGGAQGTCPSMSADKNGDGIVDTVEGGPSYGPILTTLSVKGDTSPAAGTNVKTAPGGASYTYQRTIDLDAKTVASVKAGTAVIVVHGLDPATLSKKAQGEKSNLVPSLPLAATAPALCGKVVMSQMSSMPSGGVQTGNGSTSGIEGKGLIGLGVAGFGVGAAGLLLLRRRTTGDRS